MKNNNLKLYKSLANAKRARAQFERHGRKSSMPFRHYINDKRLKDANRVQYALIVK
ncbi:MAG: hypothetical protein IBX56_19965 [Methylomicrobium sp.]|nr:hypothetical protein [Methylomicrobium sp.]